MLYGNPQLISLTQTVVAVLLLLRCWCSRPKGNSITTITRPVSSFGTAFNRSVVCLAQELCEGGLALPFSEHFISAITNRLSNCSQIDRHRGRGGGGRRRNNHQQQSHLPIDTLVFIQSYQEVFCGCSW